MDWFLYDNGLRHERVKTVHYFVSPNINIRFEITLTHVQTFYSFLVKKYDYVTFTYITWNRLIWKLVIRTIRPLAALSSSQPLAQDSSPIFFQREKACIMKAPEWVWSYELNDYKHSISCKVTVEQPPTLLKWTSPQIFSRTFSEDFLQLSTFNSNCKLPRRSSEINKEAP